MDFFVYFGFVLDQIKFFITNECTYSRYQLIDRDPASMGGIGDQQDDAAQLAGIHVMCSED